MINLNQIWRNRVQAYIQELSKYIRYMFNDHLLFVLIIGGGAGLYHYSEWVRTLDEDFPLAFVMASLLALTLSYSPIITLLKRADLVFLLPLETKLTTYFRKGIFLSFFTQFYISIFVLVLCMPMYVQITKEGYNTFFSLLVLVLLLKLWNLLIHWWMLKNNNSIALVYDWLIRFFITFLLLYFMIGKANFWYIVTVFFILVGFTIYVGLSSRNKRIQWELLIEREEGRMQRFYHLANMFTDVPHLRGKVKRRKWLDGIFSFISFEQKEIFRFIYWRTILRTSEFSGLILRLTIIAILIIIFNGSFYLTLIIALLFLYLTGFQLFPLLRKHDFIIWTDLYPVSPRLKKRAFLDIVFKVLLGQAFLFGISAWIGLAFIEGVIVLGVSIIFTVLFAKIYTPLRMKKLSV